MHFDRGDETVDVILSRFLDLVACCFGAYNVSGSNRSIIEDIFEQEIIDNRDMVPA